MGMTDRDKKVLAIVAAIVVLGGYWFLVLGKKRSAIKEAEAAQVAAQAELASAQTAETAALKVAKVKPAAYSRLLRLGKAIPVDDDFQSLLVQVNDITAASGVMFVSLTAASGSVPAVGATGSTTCDAGASGASAAAPAAPASPATGASGSTGSTAESGYGKARDKAKAATAESNAATEAAEAAAKAAECADSPTLTDIAAKAAGLQAESYSFVFNGSFYRLKDVYNGLLDFVTVENGKVGVTGRLLDINSISMSISEFPMLNANVQITGYKLPVASASNGTELNATATTPAASAGAAADTANDSAAAPAQ